MSMVFIPFSEPYTTVGSEEGQDVIEEVNVKGVLRKITVSFPDGCNSLVRLVCKVNNNPVLPTKGYIALNDTTVTYDIDRKIDTNDKLVAEIENTDPTNPHTISLLWHIEEMTEAQALKIEKGGAN